MYYLERYIKYNPEFYCCWVVIFEGPSLSGEPLLSEVKRKIKINVSFGEPLFSGAGGGGGGGAGKGPGLT